MTADRETDDEPVAARLPTLKPEDEARVERVAEAIYRGLFPKAAEHAIGPTRDWKTDAPWDTNPNELCEWERDEYRAAAICAIAAYLTPEHSLSSMPAPASDDAVTVVSGPKRRA
ncbi:MAG: hypothetical protein ACHREM_20530 [Polyangiales bacterium]